MRNYKKVVTIVAISLVSLVVLIAFGVRQAMKNNKASQDVPIAKTIKKTKKSSTPSKQEKQSEKEFVSTFLTNYTNYSNFDDYKKNLKPFVTSDVAKVLNLDKDQKDFGSSSSVNLNIYEGSSHQYFCYTTQSLNSGLNIPMAVMISVKETKAEYQVSSIYEPSLRGVAVDYIKYWDNDKQIGISVKTKQDKTAEAFLRGFNNFSSLNKQKNQIKPFLTPAMQEKLAVNNLGDDTELLSEIDNLYLFKGTDNAYVGFVQVNLSGEKSNQVIAFKLNDVDGTYLVSNLNQPTRQ